MCFIIINRQQWPFHRHEERGYIISECRYHQQSISLTQTSSWSDVFSNYQIMSNKLFKQTGLQTQMEWPSPWLANSGYPSSCGRVFSHTTNKLALTQIPSQQWSHAHKFTCWTEKSGTECPWFTEVCIHQVNLLFSNKNMNDSNINLRHTVWNKGKYGR